MTADNASGVQLSLLQGFVSPQRRPEPSSGIVLAAELPVAKVLIESSLPHLDRVFDYSVPAELADDAQPGVRVKVRFSGQELNGYLTERTAASETSNLSPIGKVLSAVPVLTPAVLRLAEAVAARYAGSVSDVLRVAIPPRVAKLDKDHLLRTAALQSVPPSIPASSASSLPASSAPGPSPASVPASSAERGTAPSLLHGYRNGDAFLSHLAAGGSPRAVLSALSGYGSHAWHHQLAQAIAHCHQSGRGAVAVVPDQRDLLLLEEAVAALLPADSFVRLTAEDGPTPRYRNFLRVLSGEVRVVLGTRSAAFAPVANPGLFCCWDDGDDLHVERRAPYQHSRDVLLLRAEQHHAAMLLAGHARSTEGQRLLNTRWAEPIVPERALARTVAARVISTADSYEQERDPLAGLARLPQRAWQSAKEALARGPVLVQVARSGYAPSLACQRCREIARCRHCQGPLMEPAGHSGSTPILQCRWCGTAELDFSCAQCGSRALRRVVVGAARTAEELGKAFPGVQVVSSAGDHVKAVVGDGPALVVATIGAEPVAPTGYAAALLLDGDALLRRESLRASEETLRLWFNAAALVRPAAQGGTVVVTAEDQQTVGALVRWDPGGFAERELSLRQELGLPPAVRIASLTGGQSDIESFITRMSLPPEVRVVGPAALSAGSAPTGHPLPVEDTDYRSLIFIPFAMAADIVSKLRALKASNAAKRTGSPVQVRCDGLDVI
ncbi:primosomal protein N' [Paenarthrobacter sp. Z7-10]|uniref:primosomal protein N' n=1 Tax=Paenarthrobacter sp. Z7-10 TaxID=2787635 RepID=UPI0022A9142A|nr:primosomal protein N' [Paenarthrobacter sp. Z7-10]MCZ2402708.1 primosomal protein N' [Paenarthrobacter sp. Z7-10]